MAFDMAFDDYDYDLNINTLIYFKKDYLYNKSQWQYDCKLALTMNYISWISLIT